jgi:plastocyanin
MAMTGGGGAPGKINLSIVNFQFPADPHIHMGDTVIWTNNDPDNHTVTEDTGAFDSSPNHPMDDIPMMGGTYSHTFNTAGTFHYHCKVHTSMHGVITVT